MEIVIIGYKYVLFKLLFINWKFIVKNIWCSFVIISGVYNNLYIVLLSYFVCWNINVILDVIFVLINNVIGLMIINVKNLVIKSVMGLMINIFIELWMILFNFFLILVRM